MRASKGLMPALIMLGVLGTITASGIEAQTLQETIGDRQGSLVSEQNSLAGKSLDDLQKEKIIAEILKIRQEAEARDKILPTLLNALSLFVPLLLGVVTLYFQQESARRLKEQEIKSNFKLKVADFVINSTSPSMANRRLRIMTSMFQDVLGPDFQSSIEREQFPSTRRTTVRDNLFAAIAAKANNPKEILEAHRDIFPEEREWTNEIKLYF